MSAVARTGGVRLGARRAALLRTVVISLALVLIAVVCALPLYFVVVTSFKTPTQYADSLFAPPGGFSLTRRPPTSAPTCATR
jgi:ABC-type glycerol-3-phosphate transport system permease component